MLSWSAFISFKLCFDPKSGLLFSDEGLFYNSGLAGGTYVKWSEVASVHLTSDNNGTSTIDRIEVRARPAEGFSTIERPGFIRRIMLRATKTKVLIGSQTLGATYEEIVAAFRTHQPHPVIDERSYY